MKKHPRIRKLLLHVLVPLMLICVLLAVFLPAFASTSFVRSRLLQTINSKIGGRVEVGDAAFSWGSGQVIRGIRVIDPDGAQVVTIANIQIGPSLWALLTGNRQFHCRVEKFDADIVLDDEGVSNLERAIRTPSPKKNTSSQPTDTTPVESRSLFRGSTTLDLVDAVIRTSGPSVPTTSARLNSRLYYDGQAGTLQWMLDGETGLIEKNAPEAASTGPKESMGKFDVAFAVTDILDAAGRLQSDKLKADANVVIHTFPTAFADALLGLDGLAAATIGPMLTIDFKAKGWPRDIALRLVAKSEHFAAKLALTVMNDRLTLREQGDIGITISAELIDHLQSSLALPATIEQPFDATLILESLSLPFDLATLHWAAFSVKLDFTPVNLVLPEKETRIRMDSTRLVAESDRLQDGIKGTLGATIITGGQSSRSDITVKLVDLFTNDLLLSPSDATATLDGTIEAPVDFVNAFVGETEQRDMLAAVLGKKMKATVKADARKNQQRAAVKINSDNASASVNGTLFEDRVTLNQPLVATQIISPELSRTLLKSVNPLLVTAVGSERPVEFKVQNDGFVFPLQENISGFEMPKATLDFGKVLLDNGGLLGRLVTLLKQRSLASTKQLEAWFTPIHATVKQGVATYQRSDMLVGGSLHLATWGSVNLTNNQMDMVIGIPSDTLDNAFDLEGLATDYVFQIPIKGTTEAPEIDWAGAGRQLAAMTAEQQLGGKLGKVSELVSGAKGLLNKATNASLIPEMPPAPAAPILPWKSINAVPPAPKDEGTQKPAKNSPVKDLLDSVFR